jgi:hypothetical protein
MVPAKSANVLGPLVVAEAAAAKTRGIGSENGSANCTTRLTETGRRRSAAASPKLVAGARVG